MTQTIRAGEPRELLALVPFQLGFVPQESLVLISLREPRNRVGLMARVDLVDLGDRADGLGAQLARNLVAHACADGARQLVPVAYVDDDPTEGEAATERVETALATVRTAADGFVDVGAAWLVGPTRYHPREPDGTVGLGRPLVDLESTQVGAHMVLAGASVVPERRDLGRLPVPTASTRATAVRELRRWRAVVAAAASDGPEAAAWRDASVAAWRDEMRRCAAEQQRAAVRNRPTAWGRLGAGLEDVAVRDRVLLTLVPGTWPAASAWGGDPQDAQTAWAISAIVDPSVGVPPDPDVCGPAARALRHVAAHHPEGSTPALTLLGLLSWWEGSGAEARVWLDRALATDPTYRLALLLTEAVDAGMPPGWVRARRAAG